MPSDYKVSSQAEELLNQVKGLEFADYSFPGLRSTDGAEPKAGAEI